MVYLQPSLIFHMLLSFLVLTTEGVVQSKAPSTAVERATFEETPTQSENIDVSYTSDPFGKERSRTNDNSGVTIGVYNGCRRVKENAECSMCQCKTIGNKRLFVDCSGKGLHAVPKCIPPETTDLDLSNNNISEIDGDSFRNLTHLKKLDLNNISLITMHPSALHSLSKLLFLDISRNPGFPMTDWTIDRGLFQNLTKLKVLRMYGTTQYLSNGTYPDDALSKLVALQELNIDGLHNKTFGPGFKSLRSLRTVHMSGFFVEQDLVVRYCSTNILQGMLDNLEMIEKLIMRGCYIMSIHPNAFDKTRNLTYLDLSDNRELEMTGVKPAFESLARTKLKVLKLNAIYNRLYDNCGVALKSDDVEGIKNLKDLRELHLESNVIVTVQHRVLEKYLTTLEVLNVRNNEFAIGPYLLFVQHLKSLQKLDISYQSFPKLMKEHIQQVSTNSRLQETMYSSVNQNEDGHDIVTHSTVKSRTETSNEMTTHGLEDKWTFVREDVFPQKYGFEEHIQDYLFTPTVYTPNGISSDEEEPDDKSICHQPPQSILQIVTPHLPPNLTTIDLSFSKLGVPIFRINVSSNNQLTILNLSQCMLYCWDGPVDGAEKLEYLNLRRNFCTNVRRGFFDNFPNLKKLIISENLLNVNISRDRKGRYFRELTKLEELEMSYNRLEVIPEDILQHQTNLRRLDVSKNILSDFNLTISHMKQLEVVNLSYNIIFTLGEAFRENLNIVAQRTFRNTKKKLQIDLCHNSLHCCCSNLDFLRWLRDMNGSTYMIIQANGCMLENGTHTDISNKHNLVKVIETLEKQCASYFALAVLLTALLFFVINFILAIIVYRYRWRIRYWYYVTKRDVQSRQSGYQRLLNMSTSGEHALISGMYKYHAFIASTENDRMFVLDNLMPVLKERRLRLCVPDVDFVPGQNLYRMISNAIHSSKISVFVVSSGSTLDSEWEIAMRMAQQESLRRGKQSFFAIFLEEIPTSQVFSSRWIDIGNMYRNQEFITYPSQVQAEELGLFWDECSRRINESEGE